MTRSQRILIAIGVAAIAAMAAPYVTRAIVDRQVTEGKVMVFEIGSMRENKDLVLCLIKHPGALNLTVASNDAYIDAATGLAVTIEKRGAGEVVKGWLPEGKALGAEQLAQVKGCAAK